MSWLYSQALVGACSQAKSLDGEPSAPLNVMLTPQQFWRNDKMTDCSKPSLFGLTLKHLTQDHGEELLTSYLAGFHAKTLAQQEKAKVSKGAGRDYGKKCYGLFAIYDREKSLWKTSQCSLLEDCISYSETWPKQGMTVNGCAYLLPRLALTTSVSEFGYWATPTTMDKLPPKSKEALTREATQARPGRSKPANLRDQVSNMKNWPTPTAHNSKEQNSPSEAKRNTPTLASIVGGKLNPNWVEWLMGWPTGWTDLKPLVTGKYLSAQQKHTEYCRAINGDTWSEKLC